jgi:hypothetical protein
MSPKEELKASVLVVAPLEEKAGPEGREWDLCGVFGRGVLGCGFFAAGSLIG